MVAPVENPIENLTSARTSKNELRFFRVSNLVFTHFSIFFAYTLTGRDKHVVSFETPTVKSERDFYSKDWRTTGWMFCLITDDTFAILMFKKML